MAAPKEQTKCARKPLRRTTGKPAKPFTCYLPNQTQPSSRPMFGYSHPGCL